MLETAPAKTLLIDDDPMIFETLQSVLDMQEFELQYACCAEEGFRQALISKSDLLILDISMPGQNGFELCKNMRANPVTRNTPIIIYSGNNMESDVITALTLGADDFVDKYSSIEVLIARMRSLLRRARSGSDLKESDSLRQGTLVLDCVTCECTIDKKPVDLTRTEFKILEFFMRNTGKVLTRASFISEIQGDNFSITERTIDVHVASLRKKLSYYKRCLETVRGVGYRFIDNQDLLIR